MEYVSQTLHDSGFSGCNGIIGGFLQRVLERFAQQHDHRTSAGGVLSDSDAHPVQSPSIVLSASEILARSLAAQKKAGTFGLAMNMALNIEATGGKDPGKVAIALTGTSSVDAPGKQVQLISDLKMSLPGEADQTISLKVYITGGWAYIGYTVPGEGEQWAKSQLTDQIWNQMGGQDALSALLLSALSASQGNDETINGVSCYVVNATPNADAISALLKSQIPAGEVDLSGIDFNKFLQPLVLKSWIDKSSFLPLKQSLNYALTLTPQDIASSLGNIPEASAVPGDLAEGFDQMVITLTADINYSDFGKPVVVTVPPAAQSAPEMSIPGLEPTSIPTPTR